MGVELLGAHVHLEVAGQEVDPSVLGEAGRDGPGAEAGEIPGRPAGDADVFFAEIPHGEVLRLVFTLAHLPASWPRRGRENGGGGTRNRGRCARRGAAARRPRPPRARPGGGGGGGPPPGRGCARKRRGGAQGC